MLPAIERFETCFVCTGKNQIFRELGNGKFAALLEKTIKDPTMLLWLNANDNRKSHPNENLSRELMELFTLGLGNYSEKDVRKPLGLWLAGRPLIRR